MYLVNRYYLIEKDKDNPKDPKDLLFYTSECNTEHNEKLRHHLN